MHSSEQTLGVHVIVRLVPLAHGDLQLLAQHCGVVEGELFVHRLLQVCLRQPFPQCNLVSKSQHVALLSLS